MSMTWGEPRLLVPPAKFSFPAYLAAIICVPWGTAEVTKAAMPLVKETGSPSGEPSEVNWTAPAGTAVLGAAAVKVAVMVRLDVVGEGLAEEARKPVTEAGVMVNWPSIKMNW